MFDNTIKEIKKYIDEDINSSYGPHYKRYIKKLKACPNLINDLKELNKKTKWMNKCSMLLVDDKIIHNMKEINCNVAFSNNKTGAEHISMGLDVEPFDNGKGIFIHTDCWKFIKKNYNINLKFSNLPPYVIDKKNYYKLFNINYGEIEKYWQQDFNFPEIVIDKKEYLCSKPDLEDKNISQIKKNINQLKLKDDPNRKGPIVSATFYNEGDIKIGINKNFWNIKGKKWVEINEKVIKMKVNINFSKLTNKQRKFFYGIKYIGEFNKNPIFYLSSNEFILLESFKEKLMMNL
jgi:hypothetical protein